MTTNTAKFAIKIFRILTIVTAVLFCDSFLNSTKSDTFNAAYAQQAQQGINKIPQIAPVSAPGLNPSKTSLKSNSIPLFSLSIGDSENSDDLVPALRIVAILTILSLAPAILLLTSAFTRILIVLGFVRQALGSPTMPPNQVLIGLSLFLTYFVMAPTTTKIYDTAIAPYMAKTISGDVAFDKAQAPLRDFMLAQVRKEDIKLFLSLSQGPIPQKPEDIPMRVLIPSFVISELKSAFQIGFLVYLPFIIIDMIVSSVLMAMGMMMLPPTVVSLPLKIILFVVVDGWNLLAGSLIRSFS
ncbi:flagellar biosynthetic protein FliP [bacterium]|nr:flagellar biosynthetic protein FliP [bacterium]